MSVQLRRMLAVAVLLVVLIPGCLLTDRMGLEPAESTKGAQVKQILIETAQILTVTTQWLFMQNGLSISASTGSFANDVFAAGLLTPLVSTIKENTYYTNNSVEDCRTKVTNEGLLIIGQSIQNMKVACNSPPDQDCLNTYQANYTLSGMVAQQVSALCHLKQTGRILHFGGNNRL